MEKLKKALEKAYESRVEEQADPGNSEKMQFQSKEFAADIMYTQTKIIEVQSDVLREKCIITGSENDVVTDAYRVLRTHVLQRLRENNWNTLAVTSPRGGNGKTVTAINLAISLSKEVNQTVLLVDLDLRHPNIQKYFSLEGQLGISEYLSGKIELREVLFNPGIQRLVVLPGNKSFVNSSEMLSSPKMVELVDELKSYYLSRIVLFDMPPVLSCDDMLAFSPYIDSTLLVVEDGETKKKDLHRVLQLLDQSKIIGTVLNKSRDEASSSEYTY
ncbi:MAG: CpsD/CapB family tyrosine-protein kinase [Candidatus Thiodiazotropha sp. (ex Dulcina madagascariensis)]|nr:CpsD/CapB family tyrosine-protein kinase [Candidatus Thiodiazotropha sp. (ex Dulcina madagascariensis)]